MEVNKKNDETKDEPADFEKAMTTTGFGIFNILLLAIGTIASCASVFETSSMSYILPIAECDLGLTLFEKGILNAVTYGGMITSAVIWGYLADTMGRKNILVYGFLADAICVLCSSLSQNFQTLVVFKYLGGFIVNGPGVVIFTYLTEMHSSKHRSRVLMSLGMMSSIAVLSMPLLAFGIFPKDWEFVWFGSLKVHSWQIFLMVCGFPSLMGGLCFIFMPESPKFLMSQGRNAEALLAFQKMYAINMRKSKHSFPIKELVEEVPPRFANVNEHIFTIENKPIKPKFKREHRTFSEALKEGMVQIKPLFRKPILGHSLHAYTMNFFILFGINTIRLWLPQLFASIAEYEALSPENAGLGSICTILEYSVNKTMKAADLKNRCIERPEIPIDTYINNIIVAGSGFIGYCFAGAIVRALGAKRLLTLGLLISSGLGIGLYWSVNGITTLIISSVFITIGGISTSSLLSVAITLFPTSLRSLVVAIVMMFGRLGALTGNLLFPILIKTGCIPPFLMVAFVLFAAAALSCILPNQKDATLA